MGPTWRYIGEYMRYKFKFQQHVNGIETCEAVIDAENQDEAYDRFMARTFTTYLIMKQDVERALVDDFSPEITVVNATD
jgi:hypothetical protein